MATSKGNTLNFIQTMNDFDMDQLTFIEEELRFRDIVSIGFLLYGQDHVNAQYMLQKLLIIFNAPQQRSNDVLLQYARLNADWRNHIVEVLVIIRAKRVLNHLGFDWEELRLHYLPHIPEISLHINPVLKALYNMCDKLKCAKALELINAMKQQSKLEEDTLNFKDPAYLEIFLLHWLSSRVIEAGKMNAVMLEKLLVCLKLVELHSIRDMLAATINCHSKKEQIPRNLVEPIKSEPEHISDDTAKVEQTLCQGVDALSLSKAEAEGARAAIESHKGSENCYKLRKHKAGIILIINQQQFYRETDAELQDLLPSQDLPARTGTDLDREALKNVFSTFGYEPVLFNNLTHLQMKHQIRQCTIRSFQYDSLIVCILSHGAQGVVYGCNSIPVEICDIEQLMASPSLQNKPKLLILQACQRNKVARAEPNELQHSEIYSTPDPFADMLKAMSTVPHFVSLRHKENGSWFIQTLCEKVNELGDHLKMQDIMTRVIDAVRGKRGDNEERMVPSYTSSMTKDFFMPKRRA